MITLGSDGHQPEHLAYAFSDIKELLLSCGVRYLTQFHNRKPEFIKL
jgi:histidinol-phosphatase (PHP family)